MYLRIFFIQIRKIFADSGGGGGILLSNRIVYYRITAFYGITAFLALMVMGTSTTKSKVKKS